MRVLERFVRAKSGDPERCEDKIVLTDDFVAVIDGATDKTGRRYTSMSGGRFAAEVLGSRIESLPAEIDAIAAVDDLTNTLRSAVVANDSAICVDADDTPTASCAVWSRSRNELWRIGDVAVRTGHTRTSYRHKRIDQVAAGVRSAHMQALILAGKTTDQLVDDPGRQLILPLLEQQHRFRNLESEHARFAFGALDGRRVPQRFLDVIDCEGAGQIIMATDGYPSVAMTLDATERYLQRELRDDPLRIGRHPSTKGVRAGHESFDDRAYVRFRI